LEYEIDRGMTIIHPHDLVALRNQYLVDV